MDVFSFREELITEYMKFTRSFTKIRSDDIACAVDEAYRDEHFWPAPLVQLNPNFQPGGYVDKLVADGELDHECSKIFRIKSDDDSFGESLLLHKHQSQAIDIAKQGRSYVLTTGTGSGKSLAYFIPIVDDVLRRKKAGKISKGISAIVVYPMNALCNSQREELARYLQLGYGKDKEPVTFARYTGQESHDEREKIAKNPPDILLTNYVMLELIMTRFQETDKAIREHSTGLRFLVLDELHTYRGRQGADVAMLVRRVRERFNDHLLCIGTSATMSSEGTIEDRNAAVANIASRLFGVSVNPGDIISESLKPVTTYSTKPSKVSLWNAIQGGVPSSPTHDELAKHPVAAWIEQNLGLKKQSERISRPLTIVEASEQLAKDSGIDVKSCGSYLSDFLLNAHRSYNERGKSFFAFRLHQFISGAWNVYSTLEVPGERYLTLNGQQFKPGNRERRLFSLCFCRLCGQEYIPVWANFEGRQLQCFEPRDLTDRSNDEEHVQFGYLMPDPTGEFDTTNIEAQFPESWLDFSGEEIRLKNNFRQYRPLSVNVDTLGQISPDGMTAWFIPKVFRFCLNSSCDAHYDGSVRSDLTKLSGLSSEGRSSATTVLALASMKYLIGTDLDEPTKKLLAFTDNRQDASLQAGHFNDFIQILMLRGALLAAILKSNDKYLTDDVLTQQVLSHLNLDATDYAVNPDTKGPNAQNTQKALRDIIGYRLYFDLQRGWRITNPNLEQLQLLEISYQGLMKCCEDEEEWQAMHPLLSSISPQKRLELIRELLERMRRSLCIKTIYLDPDEQEQFRNRSYNELREPWGISEGERLSPCSYMIPRPRVRVRKQDHNILNISYRSNFGRKLKSQAIWGYDNSQYPAKFDESVYNQIIDDILSVLTTYGYIERTDLDDNRTGYRIVSSFLEWRVAQEIDGGSAINSFFPQSLQECSETP